MADSSTPTTAIQKIPQLTPRWNDSELSFSLRQNHFLNQSNNRITP